VHDKLSYDLARDLLPIARATDTLVTAAVPAALGPTSLTEFVALAKSKPDTLNAAGAAGVPDFTLGYFLKTHELAVTRVPYRDIVPAATDLAAGQIQFLLSSAAVVRAPSQAGRVRILAVTSRQRASIFPNVPTIYEAGFPALNVETTAGLYGPKGMARELRERLAKDVIAAVSEPDVTQNLIDTGQVVRVGGPDELAQTLKEQAEQMAIVAKALGLKANK
jgi:tripartite-type tricarboxylate transporter receptor subunit TctC